MPDLSGPDRFKKPPVKPTSASRGLDPSLEGTPVPPRELATGLLPPAPAVVPTVPGGTPHSAGVPESDGPVARWRADRTVDVLPAAYELARRAFCADDKIQALHIEFEHCSGAAWVKVEMEGCQELLSLDDTPGWPSGVPVSDLANIAFDLGDEAETETPIVLRRGHELTTVSATSPEHVLAVAPPPPLPGRLVPTVYLDELDPIFKDRIGEPIGRTAKLSIPERMEVEDLLSMVEHAAAIGRVAMKFQPLPAPRPDEPSAWQLFRSALSLYAEALESRKDQPTTGTWTARLQATEKAWLPDQKTVRIDIMFEEGANWGNAGVDSALLRALPDLYRGLELQVANQGVREGRAIGEGDSNRLLDLPGGNQPVQEAEALVLTVQGRASFLEEMGKGAVLETFTDGATALLMTRAQFANKHDDFKLSDSEQGPRALAQDPVNGGTSLFPVRFTDDYLAAEVRAVAASERIAQAGDTEEVLLTAAEGHRTAAEEARKLGLPARTHRHASLAGHYQEWAGVVAANASMEGQPLPQA